MSSGTRIIVGAWLLATPACASVVLPVEASVEASVDVATNDAAPPTTDVLPVGRDVVDVAPGCTAPRTQCSDGCVDLASDVNDCGRCGTNCRAPVHAMATCIAGACTVVCDPGLVFSMGMCSPVRAPRPIAPLSTATVTSQRPTLRWELAPGADSVHVDLCRDRACTMMLPGIDATGTSVAPVANLPRGALFWRLHSRTSGGTAMETGPTWEFSVGARTAPVDTSWGTTLDLNGDGFADVAVGAWGANANGGRAYVFFGSARGLAGRPDVSLTGPDGGFGGFGGTVVSAGDVNGDGYADFAVGASGVNGYAGRAYVYLGGAGGLARTASTTLIGVQAGGLHGASVASAGDVNGDGYADLVVGEPGTDNGTGRAYVFMGSMAGLSNAAAATMQGSESGAQLGLSVAGAGDVNGDGFADVVVGAGGFGGGLGRAYLYLGGRAGISTTAATTLTGLDGTGALFGSAVAGAGDVNGDGYADVVVGAWLGNGGVGHAYVYLGSATGLSAMPATILVGTSDAMARFGTSVAGAGDVNGDGYSDLIVGADGVGAFVGRAHVFLGSATGTIATPATTMQGPEGGGYFGFSVAGAGDVNGDGFADTVVGAYGANVQTGRAYLYGGSATGLPLAATTVIVGPDGPSGYFGRSVADAGFPRLRTRFAL